MLSLTVYNFFKALSVRYLTDGKANVNVPILQKNIPKQRTVKLRPQTRTFNTDPQVPAYTKWFPSMIAFSFQWRMII